MTKNCLKGREKRDLLTGLVSGLVEVGGERPGLVLADPLGGGAVLVVGEDVVVVRVEAGQHGAARGAAHGRRHEAVLELGALLAQVPVQLRHELQRSQLHV